MTINSISTGGTSIPSLRLQSEANEAVKGGRDVSNDGDSDDGNSGPTAISPSTNMQGQTIGTLINTKA